MTNQRITSSMLLVFFCATAHAHEQEAIVAVLEFALIVFTVPFLIFIFLWRNSIKNKLILMCSYSTSVFIAFYVFFSDTAVLLNEYFFYATFFGIPVLAWLSGYYILRTDATQLPTKSDLQKPRVD